MKVQHGKFMQPELMEGIMELVAQSCATFEARGTPEYDAYLMRLPAGTATTGLSKWKLTTV